MEVEGNRTTRNTSKPAQTVDGTDRQTDIQTDRHTDRQTDRHTDRHTDRQTFFLLLFWGCGRLIRPQKEILA